MDEKKVREAIEYFKIMLFDMEGMEFNHIPKYYETAIKALEKQLPKKPKQADEQRVRYCTTHVCPGCGKEFTGMVSEYCYHCGQRIEYDD